MMTYMSRILLSVFILYCITQIELRVVYNGNTVSDPSSINVLISRISGRIAHVINEIGSNPVNQINTNDYAINSTVIGDSYSFVSSSGSVNTISSVSSASNKSKAESVTPTVSQSSLTKPSVKEVYYDWNDSISQYSIIVSCLDYNQMCSAILKVIKGPHDYKILHDGYPGGLGHKYFSFYLSLTYALLLNHRFYGRIDSMNSF